MKQTWLIVVLCGLVGCSIWGACYVSSPAVRSNAGRQQGPFNRSLQRDVVLIKLDPDLAPVAADPAAAGLNGLAIVRRLPAGTRVRFEGMTNRPVPFSEKINYYYIYRVAIDGSRFDLAVGNADWIRIDRK